jgi:hypothetical protein
MGQEGIEDGSSEGIEDTDGFEDDDGFEDGFEDDDGCSEGKGEGQDPKVVE